MTGELPMPDSNRPTVKRILELYRKSRRSSSDDSSKPAEMSGTAALPATEPHKRRPVIMVRPQIVVVNSGDAAHLDRTELKQMISDALAKAVGSPEWELQMEEAITAAQGRATFVQIVGLQIE